MNAASLTESKKALRAVVLSQRGDMSADQRQRASEAIHQRLIALEVYRQAHTVAAYMSFGAEVDTSAFVRRALTDGKTLALPRIDKSAGCIRLHRIAGEGDLVAGVWGIREPRADAPEVEVGDVDMALMPGLAFDHAGNRLGYGAGYYDRLMADAGARPVRVAAAFDCQVVDAVPTGAADRPIHILVTESITLRFPT